MQVFHVRFQAMGSGCEVVLAAGSQQEADEAAQAALDEVRRIESKYSRYRRDSIVSRLNAAAGGEAVACDAETWSLFEYAHALHASSGGLFDITSGVLRRAWDFKEPRLPGRDQIESLLGLVNWAGVERSRPRVRLPVPGMEIDFGGFGKEYAADRAGGILEAQGCTSGYVNLAGDIRVLGPKPDGTPWMIGIQDPRQRGKLLATMPMERGGLATSGDYERYFELEGRRYCHVLDPRTGQPVTHWRTVSVVAPLAVAAGSVTTIAMLKQSQAIEFLESTGLDYLAVDQEGKVHARAHPPH